MDTLEKTFAMTVLDISPIPIPVCHPQTLFWRLLFWIIYFEMLNEMFVCFYGIKMTADYMHTLISF